MFGHSLKIIEMPGLIVMALGSSEFYVSMQCSILLHYIELKYRCTFKIKMYMYCTYSELRFTQTVHIQN